MCIYIYRCTYSITVKEETPQHTHTLQVAQQTSAQARPSPEIPTFKQVGGNVGGS